MTTQKKKEEDQEQSEQDDSPFSPPIQDALDILLSPYEPCKTQAEAEKFFTTNEIIASLERHYGVPQGTTDYFTPDAGFKVVTRMKELGFSFVNSGGLELQWIMRSKSR